jgi:peptide alpha-N-acetyltransferase
LKIFFANSHNASTQFQDAGTTPVMSQNVQTTPPGIHYAQYDPAKEAEHLPQIRQLISSDLSEPYSIYVYRYFLYQWADLCFMVNSQIHELSLSDAD